jgi:hypothetical protein
MSVVRRCCGGRAVASAVAGGRRAPRRRVDRRVRRERDGRRATCAALGPASEGVGVDAVLYASIGSILVTKHAVFFALVAVSCFKVARTEHKSGRPSLGLVMYTID